jgi:hypothetical protein
MGRLAYPVGYVMKSNLMSVARPARQIKMSVFFLLTSMGETPHATKKIAHSTFNPFAVQRATTVALPR